MKSRPTQAPITPAKAARVFPRIPERLSRSTRKLLAIIAAGIES